MSKSLGVPPSSRSRTVPPTTYTSCPARCGVAAGQRREVWPEGGPTGHAVLGDKLPGNRRTADRLSTTSRASLAALSPAARKRDSTSHAAREMSVSRMGCASSCRMRGGGSGHALPLLLHASWASRSTASMLFCSSVRSAALLSVGRALAPLRLSPFLLPAPLLLLLPLPSLPPPVPATVAACCWPAAAAAAKASGARCFSSRRARLLLRLLLLRSFRLTSWPAGAAGAPSCCRLSLMPSAPLRHASSRP